jgi:hypothetical protein
MNSVIELPCSCDDYFMTGCCFNSGCKTKIQHNNPGKVAYECCMCNTCMTTRKIDRYCTCFKLKHGIRNCRFCHSTYEETITAIKEIGCTCPGERGAGIFCKSITCGLKIKHFYPHPPVVNKSGWCACKSCNNYRRVRWADERAALVPDLSCIAKVKRNSSRYQQMLLVENETTSD